MENIFLIIGVFIYIVISFLIGFWKSKGVNLANFVASRNSTGFWAILFSLVGTIVGGGMFFGVGQAGYEAGIVGYVIGACYLVGFFLLGLLIPKIRKIFEKKSYLSMIDMIDGEYKSRKTTIAFAVVNFFIFFFILAAQFLVLGTFLSFFAGIELTYAVLLVAMVIAGLNILIYSVVGGIKKDIATDVFQMIMVIIGSLLLVSILFKASTWESISTLPTVYFSGLGYGPIFLVAAIIFFIPLIFVRFDFWQRILAAKNEKVAKKAFYWAGPITFLFYFIFTTMGMYAKSSGIINSKMATLELISYSFSGVFYVVVILAFLAAVMSTADTALNVASVSFSRLFKKDKWSKYFSNKENDKELLRFVKYSAALIGLCSVFVAFAIPDLVDLLVASFTALLILAPTIFVLIFSKKPNASAAFYSMVFGFITFVSLIFFIPKEAFVAGVFVSILSYLVKDKFFSKKSMKLLLTSTGLSNKNIKEKFIKLFNKDFLETKVLFIVSAAESPEEKWYVRQSKEELLELGIKEENFIIYHKGQKPNKDVLENIDLIYVCGGNTFYLLEGIKNSGLYLDIIEMIKRGVFYIGASAGSIIVTPNIKIAKPWDPNDRNLEDLNALGLVDFAISPHYTKEEEGTIKKIEDDIGIDIKRISDDQAILVIDGKIEIIA
jgi:Na+/proline symporter/peptidase E